MSQTCQVLRCYKCKEFQVHPTKKSKTWKCKICFEKQSFKRFYGLGTGKECSLRVQKLDRIRGELNDTYGGSDANDLGTVSDSSEHSEKEETPSQSVAKKRLTNNSNTIVKKMDSNKSNVKTSNVNLAKDTLAPTVVNHSKFVDYTQSIQDGNEIEICANNHHSISSFLEDEDIDSVLDF